MIARLLWVLLPAFAVGGVGLALASRRQPTAVQHARATKFATYFLIVHAVVAAALAGPVAFSVLMGLVVVAGAMEMLRALRTLPGRWFAPLAGQAFALIGFLAVSFATSAAAGAAIFAWLVVCAFDGFSQVAGQLAGRHPLAPRLSPGKTIEGSLGGLLAALIFAALLAPVAGCSLPHALARAALIAPAALAGDLLASLVKRRAGLKDYSQLLPGHGGVLDRFDSFLLVAAVLVVAGLL